MITKNCKGVKQDGQHLFLSSANGECFYCNAKLEDICGVCGNIHEYSELYCDENASSCGGCGEWIYLSTNHICLPELDAKLESEAN